MNYRLRSLHLLAAIAVALVAVACAPATTGRELGAATRVAEVNNAQPAGEVESVIPLAESGIDGFELTSPSFDAGAELSEAFTAAGVGLWPAFDFGNVPADAAELVLVVTDVDNSNFVHWIVSGISPTTTGFGEGELPPGAIEHLNGAGLYGWFAPSKALGRVHRYQFQLYALSTPLGLGPDHDIPALLDTVNRQQMNRTSILGILIG